jgi:alpha-tubulin suppressor-like RCC1 family protein
MVFYLVGVTQIVSLYSIFTDDTGTNPALGLDVAFIKSLTPTLEIPDETILVTGQSSFALIATENSISAWGSGFYGILGNGATPRIKYYPVTTNLSVVLQNRRIASVFSYSSYVGLITDTGEIYVWGYNSYGMGDGTLVTKSVPTKIVDVDGIVFTKVESSFTVCALTNAGQFYMWGQNDYRKLANSSLTSSTQSRPILLANPNISNKQFIQGSPSLYAVFAVTTEGVLYGWGSNQAGMFGLGTNNGTIYDPMIIRTGVLQTATVVKVKNHNYGVLVLTTDGKVCLFFFD